MRFKSIETELSSCLLGLSRSPQHFEYVKIIVIVLRSGMFSYKGLRMGRLDLARAETDRRVRLLALMLVSIVLAAGPVRGITDTIELTPGLNLVGSPVDSSEIEDLAALVRFWNLADRVDLIARYNRETQRFESCAFDSAGEPAGDGCAAPVLSGEGWLVATRNAATISTDASHTCPPLSLFTGLNLVSLPCALSDLSAHTLLDRLAVLTGGGSVRGFDPVTGRWKSAARGDVSAGSDFRLERTGAYLIGTNTPALLTPPIADAGETRSVLPGQTIILDGRASTDPDGDPLSYAWSLEQKPVGSTSLLSGADTSMPTLVPDIDGSYRVQLKVTDGIFESLPDELLLSAFSLPVFRLPGLNFSPYIISGEDPNRGAGQIPEEILRERMTGIAPFTSSVRTFGCTGDLRPSGRLGHDLGLRVVASAWLDRDDATNQAEVDCLVEESIAGNADIAIVGSEVLLRGDLSEVELIEFITQVRQRLRTAGVQIPVTTAEIGGVLLQNQAVLDAVDVVYANFYPYWEGQDLNCSVSLLDQAYQELTAAAGGKEVVVSETGWPSCGRAIGSAVPSPENAARYFLEFVSWAREKDADFFYFEAIDEPWKAHFEGPQGACWGIWNGDGSLKTGMQQVFDNDTVEYGAECSAFDEPVLDFASEPFTVNTNLPTYLIASHVEPGSTVLVNNVAIPEDAIDDDGNFAATISVALNGIALPSETLIELRVLGPSGEAVTTAVKTVNYDPGYSTAGSRLLYVDIVNVDEDRPVLSGTLVIDLDKDVVLGFLTDQHVRDISVDASELYLGNRTVLDTSSNRTVRVLPFSTDIAANAFLVSPDGSRLYSGWEIVDLESNELLPERLPRSIATGSSWAGAPIPGGPAISPDGQTIFCCNDLAAIDLQTLEVIDLRGMTNSFLSDITVSNDGLSVLTSEYAFSSGRVNVYDASDLSQPPTRISGLGDFSGRIRKLGDGRRAVVGYAGNPASVTNGGVSVFDLQSKKILDSLSIPLADNVAVEGDTDVYAASGGNALVDRIGIEVAVVTPTGELIPSHTFFLGVNRFDQTTGKPKSDRIRRILFKPAVPRAQ